nr:actin-binding protein WASF2-like [Symphalangus syndactylus]
MKKGVALVLLNSRCPLRTQPGPAPALTYAPAQAAGLPPPPRQCTHLLSYRHSPIVSATALPRPSGFQMRPAEPPEPPQLTHPDCLGEGAGEGADWPDSFHHLLGPLSAPPPPGNPLFLSHSHTPSPPILSSSLGLVLHCTAWSSLCPACPSSPSA